MQGPIKRAVVSVTTNGSGNASVQTNHIVGEILKVAYDKGNVNSSTTVTITSTDPVSETIDSYDVNSGDTVHYPRAAVTGASAGDNKWTPFVVVDNLTLTVSDGAASKTFTVAIYYR